MFTGIVATRGAVRAVKADGIGARLVIDRAGWAAAVAPGDSVCVSGVCLTHAPRPDDPPGAECLAFDVVAETLQRTTLGSLRADDAVNLEASLTLQTPMGGHVVQGHIDGVGTVRTLSRTPDCRLTVDLDDALMAYVIPKGSIAVEGVSLTVAAVNPSGFQCALIDTTLERTTLGRLETGTRVNVETDILSRTVVHWLRRQAAPQVKSGLTAAQLQAAGFPGVPDAPSSTLNAEP